MFVSFRFVYKKTPTTFACGGFQFLNCVRYLHRFPHTNIIGVIIIVIIEVCYVEHYLCLGSNLKQLLWRKTLFLISLLTCRHDLSE